MFKSLGLEQKWFGPIHNDVKTALNLLTFHISADDIRYLLINSGVLSIYG